MPSLSPPAPSNAPAPAAPPVRVKTWPVPEVSVLRRCHPALGALVDIHLAGLCRSRLEGALDIARRELAVCERVLSAHRADSDLARLRAARTGDTLELDTRTRVVLRRAAILARASGGVFDPRLRLAQDAPPFASAFLLIPGRRIRLLAPLDLDLGGIAKGHALDRAFALLRRAGVPAFSLNAGGDLRIHGLNTSLMLRAPCGDAPFLAFGVLHAGAAATSAQTYHDHLRDSRRGRVAPRDLGVTVFAPFAIDADALTKVVALAPFAPATTRLLASRHAHAALVAPGGELRWLPSPPPAHVFTPPPSSELSSAFASSS